MALPIETLLARARKGEFDPVHVLVGDETFLVERAVRALKKAAIQQGYPGLNEDSFQGDKATAGQVLSAAKTMAMMSPVRFVLLRSVDKMATAELEALAGYLEAPHASTCLVMTGEKLDGRGKFAKAAKKSGALVEVQPLKGAGLASFAQGEARARGHTLGPDACQHLLDALGEDLAAIEDAVERLSLYVGPKAPIDVAAIDACVAKIRVETIWSLVDALGLRDARKATHALVSLLADNEAPLRISAMLSRQIRMVAKMREALHAGMSDQDAAIAAGAPPFKARDLKESAGRYPMRELARTFETLASLDRALKSSKVPDDVLMIEAITSLCAPRR